MAYYKNPLFRVVPVISGGLALFTIYLCLIITSATKIDVGHLTLPYISDTGRERGAYIVFAVGLTITALLFEVLYIMVNQRLWVLERTLVPSTSFKIARWIAVGCGMVSSAGLIVVAVVNTTMDPDTHVYGAYAFFILLIVFIIINTSLISIANAKCPADHPQKASLRQSCIIKSVLCCAVCLNFILYIPVGVSIMCKWNQDPITKLYDYKDCLEIHQMRAACQHLSVWIYLVYVVSFWYDFAPENMDMDDDDKQHDKMTDLETASQAASKSATIETVPNLA